MDLSDVAVRHAVALITLDTRHSVDLSPSALAFVKEIRCCVIATVTGATIASIVRSVLESGRASNPTLPKAPQEVVSTAGLCLELRRFDRNKTILSGGASPLR